MRALSSGREQRADMRFTNVWVRRGGSRRPLANGDLAGDAAASL